MILTGIAASPGLAVGPIHRLEPEDLSVREREVDPCDFETEIATFHAALDVSRRDLIGIRDGIAGELGERAAAIYDAHLLILDDPELRKAVEQGIRTEGRNAAWIYRARMGAYLAHFDHVENEYLRERRADFLDVERRVLRHLLGTGMRPIEQLGEPAIVIAHDLGPSEVAMLPRDKVLAFVLEVGGRTSHGAIVARGRGIPAIVSVKGALHQVRANVNAYHAVLSARCKHQIGIQPGTAAQVNDPPWRAGEQAHVLEGCGDDVVLQDALPVGVKGVV